MKKIGYLFTLLFFFCIISSQTQKTEAFKVNFVIDENYVIYNIFTRDFHNQSSKEDRAAVISFQNLAWEKSPKCYNILRGKWEPAYLTNESIASLSKEMEVFFSSIKESKEYIKILDQTKERLEFCNKQWEKNLPLTLKTMEELSGFEFSNVYTIYIIHPAFTGGRYLGNRKILWGGLEEWNNYTTGYAWHEILHNYFGRSDLDHALIQLMTDEELRVRLNGGSYPPYVGHNDLYPLMDKILPYWKEYLASKDKNILKFRDKLLALKIGEKK